MKKTLLSVLLIILLPVCSAVFAKNYGSFNNVDYIKCYDGDTCTFNIPKVHPIIGEKINIRLDGIDSRTSKNQNCIDKFTPPIDVQHF